MYTLGYLFELPTNGSSDQPVTGGGQARGRA